MELSFVIDALRRYFWVVPIFAVFGMIPGIALGRTAEPTYVARAVLLVVPPRENRVEISFGGDNDRYISSELATMGSNALAEEVADRLDDGSDARDVTAAVTFIHPPRTDIVQVVAETPDPERSQRLANTLAQAYLDGLHDDVDGNQSPEAEQIDNQLSTIAEELALVDADIEQAMLPFITPPDDVEGELPPIPGVEQVVPGLASQKSILLAQYNQLLTARTELDLDPDLQVASELVQEATVPLDPLLPQSRLLIAIGFVGGTFMGLLAAVVLARLSPRLLSARHAEEIIGVPVVGPVGGDRIPSAGLAEVAARPPLDLLQSIDAVCVRAEATERTTSTLTVAVVGAERTANTTTVAVAMANRFGSHGLNTVLVDADLRSPEITRALAPDSLGISDLFDGSTFVSGEGVERDLLDDLLVPAPAKRVAILSAGTEVRSGVIGRSAAAALFASSADSGWTVVFNAGSILDASSAVQIARLADVVVLVVPNRARIANLEATMIQLRERDGVLIPIVSGGGRLDRFGTALASTIRRITGLWGRSTPAAPVTTPTGVDDDRYVGDDESSDDVISEPQATSRSG